MTYETLRGMCKNVLRPFSKIVVTGNENVPLEGGCIVCFNHTSNFDPVFGAIAVKRSLKFMAKEELFHVPLLGGVLRGIGTFPVKRGSGDIGAIKAALTILKNGNALAMFPQGRRVTHDEEGTAKSGVAMLAIKAMVPVVPASISGKYRLFGTIRVNIGQPIYFEDFYGKKASADELQALSNAVLKEILQLAEDGK